MIKKHVGCSIVTFGSIPKSNFETFSTSFWTYSHFALFQCNFVDFYAVKCLIYIFLCNFHVCKWKNAYIKDLNALRILMNFLCIN